MLRFQFSIGQAVGTLLLVVSSWGSCSGHTAESSREHTCLSQHKQQHLEASLLLFEPDQYLIYEKSVSSQQSHVHTIKTQNILLHTEQVVGVSIQRCRSPELSTSVSAGFVLLEDVLHTARCRGVEVRTPSTLRRQVKPEAIKSPVS